MRSTQLARRGPAGLLSGVVAAAWLGSWGASCAGPRAEEKAGGPDASTAGDEIVYEQEIRGNSDIYVVPATGGPPRRLTRHPGVDCHARWMPDGRYIVYTAGRGVKPQLWEVPAEGGSPRPVRRNQAGESQPDPSPDGRRLAFISDIEGSDRLMMMDLKTRATTTLVRHRDATIFGNPHWSPDGEQVVFSSNWPNGHQIYVVDVASREARPLAKARTFGCEPRFRPDGRAVAFVLRGNQSTTSRLVEQDLETGERRVLVDWPALNYDLAYSPDGREVAFASDITGQWVIYRQRLADGRAWRLTFGRGPARYPDYRPRPVSAPR
jgi:Tol biopolymer transport system component